MKPMKSKPYNPEIELAKGATLDAASYDKTQKIKVTVPKVTVGGIPGASKGAVASKSVGGQSISYDVASTMEMDAGHWGLTVYGNRFINIARMMGAGPLVSFAPCGFGGAFGASGAWAGPPGGIWPGFDGTGG